MKSIVILLPAAVTVGGMVMLSSGRASHPPLSIPEASLDFGRTTLTDAFIWDLPVRNETSRPVSVLDFEASCNCIAIRPRHFHLAPRSEQVISVTLDLWPKDLSPLDPVREFSVQLMPTFAANDEVRGSWSLRGKVESPFRLCPKVVDLGRRPMAIGEERVLAHIIEVSTHVPMTNLIATCEHESLEAETGNLDRSGTSCEVRLYQCGNILEGPFSIPLQLTPSLWDRQDVTACVVVRMEGRAVQDVMPEPEVCSVGWCEVARPVQVDCIVQSAAGLPFTLMRTPPIRHGETCDVSCRVITESATSVRCIFTVVPLHVGDLREEYTLTVDQGTNVYDVCVAFVGRANARDRRKL